MKWAKKGRIFCPSGEFGWMNTHGQIPTVLDLGDRLRIFFASRPEPNLSLTGFLDVDKDCPKNLLYVHDRPILEPGRPGAFDAHGIMPQFVCRRGKEVWLYYSGWHRRVEVPYSNWTGLSVSQDGGTTFRKLFEGPILDRTSEEIFSATGCYLLKVKEQWHMWYASGVDWYQIDGRMEEYYVIKHAVSKDGIKWLREPDQVLPPESPPRPTHRPSVIDKGGIYHMLFCHRGLRNFRDGENSYRLGYASSEDLKVWTRDDAQAGLEPSDEGWDSNMIAYPYMLKTEDKIYLFYCGNGFGSTGFGYAELEA